MFFLRHEVIAALIGFGSCRPEFSEFSLNVIHVIIMALSLTQTNIFEDFIVVEYNIRNILSIHNTSGANKMPETHWHVKLPSVFVHVVCS